MASRSILPFFWRPSASHASCWHLRTIEYYESYAKCQSRAFLTGMSTFIACGAGVYGLQELLHKRLPYGRQTFLLPTILIASLTSYAVTRSRTKACQDMWMVMEDKHSNLEMEKEGEILDSKG